MGQNHESGRIPLPDNKIKIERPRLSMTEVLVCAEDLEVTEAVLQENRIQYSIHGYSEQKVKDDGSDSGRQKQDLISTLFIVRIISVKGKEFVDFSEMSRIKNLLQKDGVTLYSQDLWTDLAERSGKNEELNQKG
ncbi:hypothetical protein A2X44_01320 [candidate division CPR3 bacterium GWF2_35_18]|uniref:Uncharacterized protein n=1 Tax=candidate division CPR3 bacterium GW2011_GWF2_35_18 TaxID=1618350 RepID=A0A0G0BLF6_UNCC3|nr:MAG: hypothetical protein UR67_C0001G0243 [candidate division CPR3 bacterium GW2011_GWF2_35_18]OGB63542.1 MAG: hypothetical protein A2X44_01320 [candidate division CPR3 bacterium GWF2_35_18]OGB64651.1 MAG: hypothetical protein A2250_03870 [candidate division CPR3 bacterium RIFOXYA2_FULL_35_13]OGB76534.1 MAG: hypothetical protein A2476_05350 [candidate division CPR3 bacterium RIFOXYC2_FULL_35_7]OGB78762.1 MAG: hypothetical protein A2296_00115 [candidate division CPR3 bacterium RIFOXYB2_FULL_3